MFDASPEGKIFFCSVLICAIEAADSNILFEFINFKIENLDFLREK